MRILVVGLDCAAPEILLRDESLVNFRHLMTRGCHGRIASVVPPITVPAWMCLSTSQDPGSLGVYGFRNRTDHSYAGLALVTSASIRELAVWDQVGREGKRAVVIGVPPNYPPRKVNGVSVGCFLTPDPSKGVFTHPADVTDEIRRLVSDYPVDVRDFRTPDKDRLLADVYAMSRKHFAVVRHFLRGAWDYFQFVEIGLDRIQHGFWKHHDPEHRQHEPGSRYRHVVRDYYRYLDEELGSLFELLDDETAVLVVSDHGARRLDGGFCVNEWLVRAGLLALHEYPREVTPFGKLAVDWARTTAWGEGGYCGRVFLNVRGREPQGTVDPADYEKVRADLKARLEATADDQGRPLGTRVFAPDKVYRAVRGVAPDLIVYFGDLLWRSVGGVGYAKVHVRENDTGPDDCNHAPFGAFILAAPGTPLRGEMEGVTLLDVAPTLLELGGYDVPASMQGRSLLAGHIGSSPPLGREGDDIIREHLRGLGYIS